MAKEQWKFHVAAYNGADTFAGPSKEKGEKLRADMLKMAKRGELEFVSSLIPNVPGRMYWVVHVRFNNGQTKSFGFDSQIEAQKFHGVMLDKVEGVELASFPTQAELNA